MDTQTILAAALTWPRVARRLAPALGSELVVANVYHRRIFDFVSTFVAEHGDLPQDGDYQTWAKDLPERERDGVLEALRDLRARDLSNFTPEFILGTAVDTLRQAAVEGARARLNRVDDPGAAWDALTAEINRVGASVAPGASVDWPERPEPLGGGAPDPIPTDTLPEPLRGYVESVAAAVQVPSDLPFLLILAALSTACAGKLRVKIRSGWPPEPLLVWTVTILEPGARKSPVFKRVMDPVKQVEREWVEDARAPREQAKMKAAVLKSQIDDRKKEAQEAQDPEVRDNILADVYALQDELRRVQIPALPTLVVQDVTVEKLMMLMAQNEGRLAMLSPEGGIFKIMAGRYKGGSATFDGYKEGWTGDEAITVHRVSRENVHIPRPALTLGLTVQPVVLQSLRNRESFRGEGLLGRFLYAAPDPGFGRRKTGDDVPPLDDTARAGFVRVLRTLLHLGYAPPEGPDANGDAEGWHEPTDLPLGEGAREAFYAWEAEVEGELGPWGEFERFRDWGSKLVGQTARVAGLLTLAARAADAVELDRETAGDPIPRERMEAAIRIARALIPHARRALLHHVEVDEDVSLARHVLARLRELSDSKSTRPPTQNDLRRAVRGKKGLERSEQLETILATLERRGWVRRVEQPSSGAGRPPSPWVLLHPTAHTHPAETVPKIPETTPDADKGDKRDEIRRDPTAADPDKRDKGHDPPGGSQGDGAVPPDRVKMLERLCRDPDLPSRLRRRILRAFPRPTPEEVEELITDARAHLEDEGGDDA